MTKFKLIALDLDGTLNNDQKVITPKTKEALIDVQKKGVTVVLASGRQYPGLARERKALELDNYHGLLLAYNGGKVVDASTDEVVYEKAIDRELAIELLRHLEQFPVTPIVDDGKDIYTNQPDGFKIDTEATNNNLGVKVVDNIADSIHFSPVKVLIAAPEEILRPLGETIMKPFEDRLDFIYSAPFYLEATMKGISKASSLKMICNKLNIKREEVMAFGDAENDMSMLQFAGHGVAMENACDSLKKVADEVTLSNNDDGIAHTIHKHFIYRK